MKHYKQLIDKDLFESTYNIKLENYDLYANPKGIKQIPTICDNCGQVFWIDRQTFKKRLCWTEFYEKCFGDIWYCNRKECTSKKKSEVCKIKMLQSENSINKRLEASKNRRGKSYEEQYGEEKAKEVKAIIKQKRKEQLEPMKGKRHSDKAKLLMSLRKQELMSTCHYLHKVAKGSIKGYVKRWYDNKELFYQSSYEKLYIELLNNKKKYYDRCSIVLPYKIDGITRHYNPDFSIFTDETHQIITHIIEIKPKAFIGVKHVKLKREALKDFCRYNNYIDIMITEDELNENKIY